MAKLPFPASLTIWPCDWVLVNGIWTTSTSVAQGIGVSPPCSLSHDMSPVITLWTCWWWWFSKAWLSSDWIPEWPCGIRLLFPSQNLDYCNRHCDRGSRSSPSGPKHSFPQMLGTLAADSLHLNSSSGIAFGQRELLHLNFHSLSQGQPTSNNWPMLGWKAWASCFNFGQL